jgi:hypothetical protein
MRAPSSRSPAGGKTRPAAPISPGTPSWAPLCVQFEPQCSRGICWRVDAFTDPTIGTNPSVGSACGPLSHMRAPAGAQDANLAIGRTAIFDLVGAPSAPACGVGTRAATVVPRSAARPRCAPAR